MDTNFATIKAEDEAFYKKIEVIYCPFFKSKIKFTRAGFEHLKFKKGNKQRLYADQCVRFRLLSFVPNILAKSGTLQGLFKTRGFEEVRVHNRVDQLLVSVTFYEFIAVEGGYRIKVIIKQVDNGELIFWSVIPFWKKNKDSTRRIHSYSETGD